jgi:hypothetical protein
MNDLAGESLQPKMSLSREKSLISYKPECDMPRGALRIKENRV